MTSTNRQTSALGDLRRGDALALLREVPDATVDCVATSPPYWGLREYAEAETVWGGEEGCEHVWGDGVPGDNRGGSGTTGLVAIEQGFRFLGFEISPAYCAMAEARIAAAQRPLMEIMP